MFRLSWLHIFCLGILITQIAKAQDDPCPGPPCTGYAVIYEPPPSPGTSNAPAFEPRAPQDSCFGPSCGSTTRLYFYGPHKTLKASTSTPEEPPSSPVKTSISTLSTSTLPSSSSSSVFTSFTTGSSSSSSSYSGFSSGSDSSFLTSLVSTLDMSAGSTVSSRTATTTNLPLPTYISSSAYIFPTSSASAASQNGSDPSGTQTTACGQCNVYADEVQVYYWPTAAVNSQCPQASGISGMPTGPSNTLGLTAQVTPSMNALSPQEGVDVVSGFTLTYPSTYLSVIGAISVTNACGVLGKTLDSPPPIAVEAIYTASYTEWPSTCRPQGDGVDVVVKKLDLSDIACPTWGVSNPFTTECGGEVYMTATVGWPYNPVILVPPEIYNYDPAWSDCSKPSLAELPCGLYDPPKALSIQQVLEPQPTPPSGPQSLSTPAAPGGSTGYDSPIAAPTATPNQTPLQAEPTGGAPHPQVTKPSLIEEDGPGSSQNHEPQSDKIPDSSPSMPQPQSQSGSNADGNSGPVPNPQNNPSSGSNAPGNVNSKPKSQPDLGAQGNTNAETNPQDRPDPKGSEAGSDDPETGWGSKAPVLAQETASSPQAAVPPRPIAQTTVAIGSPNSVGNSGGTTDANADGSQGGNPGSNLDDNAGGSPSKNTLAGTAIGGPSPFTPHPITVLGQTISAINPTAVVIASKTLTAGGLAFSTNGNYYSVGPSGSLVAGTLAPGTSQLPALTFGKSIYTANSVSQFVIGSQTLNPGQQITVSGTPVSLALSSNILVVGSSTQSLGAATPTLPPALLTFDGSTYTADQASQFVIGSQTLAPGHHITISGTPISEGPEGSFAVIAGSITQSLAIDTAGSSGSMVTPQPALLTFAGSTYTANPSSSFVIGGQTLTPGGVITVSGTAISEAPSGTGLVVIGSSTQVLSHSSTARAPATAAVMTFAGQTYTADTSGDFVISGQTLKLGSVITVAGTPISEAPDATNVVIQGSTEALSTATTSPSVMSFFGSASSHTRGTISNWAICLGWFIALLLSSGWYLLEL